MALTRQFVPRRSARAADLDGLESRCAGWCVCRCARTGRRRCAWAPSASISACSINSTPLRMTSMLRAGTDGREQLVHVRLGQGHRDLLQLSLVGKPKIPGGSTISDGCCRPFTPLGGTSTVSSSRRLRVQTSCKRTGTDEAAWERMRETAAVGKVLVRRMEPHSVSRGRTAGAALLMS